jgi:hypothetical protein
MLMCRAWRDKPIGKAGSNLAARLHELRAKVVCCSRTPAGAPSLNHQDPVIRQSGTQRTANTLPHSSKEDRQGAMVLDAQAVRLPIP